MLVTLGIKKHTLHHDPQHKLYCIARTLTSSISSMPQYTYTTYTLFSKAKKTIKVKYVSTKGQAYRGTT